MRTPVLAPPLPANVDTTSEQFRKNRDDVLEPTAAIDELLAQAEAGGGDAPIAPMRSRGKMPHRERLDHVLAPNNTFRHIIALPGTLDRKDVCGGKRFAVTV